MMKNMYRPPLSGIRVGKRKYISRAKLIIYLLVAALDAAEHHTLQPGLLRLLRVCARESVHAHLGSVPPMGLRAHHVCFIRIFHGFIR
jgi:hypothetical protein